MSEYKACIRCNQIKAMTDFAIDRSKKTGYKSVCLRCKRVEYGQENLDAPRQVKSDNPIRGPERYRIWAKANPEKRREINKRHIIKSESKVRHAELQRVYRQKNPDAYKVWVRNNPDKALEINNRRRLAFYKKNSFKITKKEVSRLYNSPCFYCGTNHNIQIDHAMPIARGGKHSIGNLLPACKKCNQSKHSKTIMEFRVWMDASEQKTI